MKEKVSEVGHVFLEGPHKIAQRGSYFKGPNNTTNKKDLDLRWISRNIERSMVAQQQTRYLTGLKRIEVKTRRLKQYSLLPPKGKSPYLGLWFSI